MNTTLKDFLHHFEACRLEAYQDGGGVWTIGYGITYWNTLCPVQKGDKITKSMANTSLDDAVRTYRDAITLLVNVRLSIGQQDALSSLAYNIGKTAFKDSTLLKKLNAGDFGGAADQFKWWRKDNGEIVPGLVRRRISEARLFCGTPNPIIKYNDFPPNWLELYYDEH